LATWCKSKFPNDKELLELCGKWTFGDTFHDKPTSAQSTADVSAETKTTEEKKAEYHNYSGTKVILLGDKFPTRTHRVSWMLYELEQEFDFEEVAVAKDSGTTAEFLAKYPLLQKDPLYWGAVPAIIDGNVALTESSTIVTYLADKHKKFVPAPGTPERLRYEQLINYFTTELEGPIYNMFLHSFILPQEAQVPQIIPFEKTRVNERLHNIERLLKENGSGFIFGNSFSAADVICGYWLTNLHRGQPLTEGFPTAAKYAEAMASRKAFQQSIERLGSFL